VPARRVRRAGGWGRRGRAGRRSRRLRRRSGADPGLRLDQLRGEDAAHRALGGEQRLPVEQLEVARQLLDPVDLAAALDLHGDGGAGGVTAHQVDRPDRGGVLAADQRQPLGQGRRVLGEQLLEVLLDAVLLQPRVDAELVGGVVLDVLQQDPQRVAVLAGHGPLDGAVLGHPLLDRARRRHPVQGLVGAAVGVHEHRPVGLDHQHPERHGQMSGEPPRVVDLAASDDQPHEGGIYRQGQGRPAPGTSTVRVSTMPSEAPSGP
jgi:hypothetical protein